MDRFGHPMDGCNDAWGRMMVLHGIDVAYSIILTPPRVASAGCDQPYLVPSQPAEEGTKMS